ncbi:demethoxyubiquinone hydroxylase family protein [Asticcacaulis sp.]|uniref:demethoxyubiquinone hydroxylase family protein n=1 Tax=Asticcacaulis sp. TaxID=1872648 RepID=UPI0026037546|nr:demethoxyubiquinone hydroxylase family protein [Asticcacaulis sp.]
MTLTTQKTIARILKVNHAGEYGAIRIYRAQLWTARWLQPDLVPFLTETLSHEIDHCRRFRESMGAYKTRPCHAMWLWSTRGWVLGLATALMGRNAVMACTAAVEGKVHRHLDEQIAFLMRVNDPLADLIADIRIQEIEHLEFARARLKETTLSRLIEAFVGIATEGVIWLSTQGAVTRMERGLRRL